MPRLDFAACINDVCPISGRPVSPDALALYRGEVVGFETTGHRDQFLAAILMFESARITPRSQVRPHVPIRRNDIPVPSVLMDPGFQECRLAGC
ncbi:hypothetical protein HDIA_0988 [Hartmannibacter diazotrophicus]|uniref:Uncharacterized protein n=1 Tax=Hartmannibacter diazotrophicus TaxID=1482074 RepID=A0A2C9D2W1_9HYPH|nr:hypothetical protein HDIA_0988 [Hartmannibacter diazotrophicus]